MLDKTDGEILLALRHNARASFRQLAQQLKMHPTTLISRVQRLEKAGVIRGYGANLDLPSLGYEFMGVVQVKIAKGKLLETQEKISRMRGVRIASPGCSRRCVFRVPASIVAVFLRSHRRFSVLPG